MTKATEDARNRSVVLTDKTQAMLAELAEAEGLDETAVINRAIKVYFEVMKIDVTGRDLMVVDRSAERVDLLKFD